MKLLPINPTWTMVEDRADRLAHAEFESVSQAAWRDTTNRQVLKRYCTSQYISRNKHNFGGAICNPIMTMAFPYQFLQSSQFCPFPFRHRALQDDDPLE